MRCIGYDESVMRDLAILFIHLVVTVARLFEPNGARSSVTESLLVKHQLLIRNRSRERAPDLRPMDRVITGFWTMTDGNPTVAACTSYPSPLDYKFATHRAKSEVNDCSITVNLRKRAFVHPILCRFISGMEGWTTSSLLTGYK